jgi:hypothetical protein
MGNKPYRVITEYISPYPDSILFHMGDFVHVGIEFDDDPDWKNWIRCNGDGGKEAWCPGKYLDIIGDTGVFIRDYDAKELTVYIGEILSVREQVNGFGIAVKDNGEIGWVPMKILEELI